MSEQGTRGIFRRRWVQAVGAFAIVLVALVLLAPTVAGWFAPGIAAGAINDSINGKATVGGVSLSWFGGQRVGPVVVSDAQGRQVASITVQVSRGLLGLLTGGVSDLGRVTVSGSASVTRGADGTLNIATLAKGGGAAPSAPDGSPSTSPSGPSGGSSGGGGSIPKGLKAELVLDKLALEYVDESKTAAVHRVSIPAFSGTASINGGHAAVDATAAVEYQRAAGDAAAPGGMLSVKATADGFADAAGNLTIAQAKLDAEAEIKDLAVAVADAIAGLNNKLVAGIGEKFQASFKAKGTTSDADLTIAASSRAVNIDVAFKSAAGVLTSTRPGFISVQGGGLMPLIPGLEAGLAQGGMTLDRLPDFKATIDNVRLPMPAAGKPLDLRGGAAALALETTETTGTVRVPQADGTPGPAQPLKIAPLKASLTSADLGAKTTLTAASSATIGGQPAGTLKVDLSVMGPPGAGLPAIQGEATIDDVATAIAQPLVEKMGLDLPAGVGPKLGITLKAASQRGEAKGGVPATDLDVAIKSAGVNGSVAVTFDGRTIRKRGGDGVFSLRSPGTLAGEAARNAGVALGDGGYAKATLRDFAVEFDERWSPRLDRSAADVEFNVGGFTVTTIPAPAQAGVAAAPAPDPVALGQLILGAKFAPGTVPAATLRGSGKHQGADFFMQGDLQLAGLIGKDGALTPGAMLPLGTIDLNNLPMSLVAFGIGPPAPPKAGEKPGPDIARLLRDAIGPAATIKIAATQPQGGAPQSRAVSLRLDAAQFKGSAEGMVDDHSRTLSRLDFRGQVTPELAGTLIDMFGAGLESKPRLVSAAMLTISATPFTIPLAKDGSMDLAKAGDASFKIGVEGKALVNNVFIKSQDGKPRDLGTVGLENTLLTASIPLASLARGSPPRPAQIALTAGVLGAADKRIVDLKAGAKVNIAAAAPQGDLNADASLKILDSAWVDSFLGKPALLTGGLGPDATVDIAAVVQFPKGGAPAGSEAPRFDRATLTASIKSANLSTTQPLKATMLPDRMAIDAPMIVKWTMGPEWANAYVLAPPKAGEPPLAKFTAPTEVTVSVFKLSLATGAEPIKPGIFLADVQIDSPGTTLAVGSGKEVVPAPLKTLSTRLTGGKEPGTLGFSLTLADAGGGPAPGGKPAVSFAGGVYGIANSAGKPTFDAARLTMNGTAAAISTAIVDALAHQGGLLNEALGPRVNLDVKAEGLSKTGGNLTVVAISPRAEARFSGTVRNGAFAIASPPAGKPAPIVKLNEASSKLGSMLVKGLPVLGSFEKRPEDGPATVNAYAMSIPIDGDLRKLNGKLVVDLGAAHFATSSAFSSLLKVINQKSSGSIGQRMDPFTVDFKDGVGAYDKFMIPLGEFRIATSGKFDLVNRQIDVVTYVPFGALTDEAAGKLNTGLGKALNGIVPKIEEATMVPFRTRGSFDSPKTEPDLGEFGKNFFNTIRPDNLIKGIFKK